MPGTVELLHIRRLVQTPKQPPERRHFYRMSQVRLRDVKRSVHGHTADSGKRSAELRFLSHQTPSPSPPVGPCGPKVKCREMLSTSPGPATEEDLSAKVQRLPGIQHKQEITLSHAPGLPRSVSRGLPARGRLGVYPLGPPALPIEAGFCSFTSPVRQGRRFSSERRPEASRP